MDEAPYCAEVLSRSPAGRQDGKAGRAGFCSGSLSGPSATTSTAASSSSSTNSRLDLAACTYASMGAEQGYAPSPPFVSSPSTMM
jgi:hypothetical protein